MNSESTVTPGTYRIARAMDSFIPGHTSEDFDLAGFTIRYDWDSVSLVSATSRSKLEVSRVSDASNLLPPLPVAFRGEPGRRYVYPGGAPAIARRGRIPLDRGRVLPGW